MMLLVVFMYRFGEGFIERFGPLFLMDPRSVGGMGFNNQAIGSIYNTYGTIVSSPVRWWADCSRRSSRSGAPSFSWPLRSTFRTSPITISATRCRQHGLGLGIVTIEKFGFGFGSIGQCST